MKMIFTTKGMVDEASLRRTVVFTDAPREFTIVVEWRLGDELGEIVKRDAHIVLKEPSEIATAIVGNTDG